MDKEHFKFCGFYNGARFRNCRLHIKTSPYNIELQKTSYNTVLQSQQGELKSCAHEYN